MNPREVRLILLGIVIGAALVVGYILFGHLLVKNIQPISLLGQIPLNKSLYVEDLTDILNNASGNAPVNVSYSGFLKLKSTYGSTSTSVTVNLSAVATRNGSSSTLDFSYVVPSSSYYTSISQTNYTVSLLKNGSSAYFCGPSLSSFGYNYYSTNCVDGTTIAILENSSYNYTLSLFNLLNMQNLKMTIKSASASTIGKAQCTLVSGTFSGTLPAYQAQTAVSTLSNYGMSVYSSYLYGTPTKASFSGSFKACLSNTRFMPLMLNASIKISGFQQPISAQLYLNETSITNTSSEVSNDTLPGELLPLSSVLRGYCSQSYTYGIGYSPSIGYCEYPTMNKAGQLEVNFTNYYYSSYYPYYQPTVRVLGLACTETPLNTYSIYTTSIYPPPPSSYEAPSPSNFTAVNITLRSYGNTSLYVNCPVNKTTKLASKFYGTLWIYYSSGTFKNVTSYTVTAYATSSKSLGSNQNTGVVHPLPSSFPTKTYMTVTATNPSDYSSKYIQFFLDKYPGTYEGNGLYTNTSSYQTYFSSGSTVYYPANFTGNHTVYMVISPYSSYSSSYYGTYSGSITINDSSVYFSGVDATHAVNITVEDSAIVNATTISLT